MQLSHNPQYDIIDSYFDCLTFNATATFSDVFSLEDSV